jgi:hypothetical protein
MLSAHVVTGLTWMIWVLLTLMLPIQTGKFIDDVREGKYGVDEGVVCKGGSTADELWMVKIKTYAYMTKLQQAFKDDWENYWE